MVGTACERNAAARGVAVVSVWFRAPRFDPSGKKLEPARVLRVLFNGQLVQRMSTSRRPRVRRCRFARLRRIP